MTESCDTSAEVRRVRADLERVTVQRDAFGDTLGNIARNPDAMDTPAAVIAEVTLQEQGYLPWGRLMRLQGELERARATIAAVKALCSNAERLDAEQADYNGTHLLPVVRIADVRAALADSLPS